MHSLVRALSNTIGFAAILLAVGCTEDSAVAPTASSPGELADLPGEPAFLIQPAGDWAYLDPMPTARMGLAAASLDNQVYAIGGSYRNFDFHSIGFFGVAAVESYDPATGTWTAAAPLPISRVYPNGATAINGRIYLPGGAGCDSPIGNCRETNTLFIFDPSVGPQGTWTVGPPMPVIMQGGTSAAINDRLYVVAGWSVGAPRNYLFRFDPANPGWTSLAGSPRSHTFGATAVLDGKLYATGGEGSATVMDIYDPASNTWTSKTMPVGYQHHAAVAIDDILYLVGGNQLISGTFCCQTVVMAYDPQTDSWTTSSPVPAVDGPYAGNVGLPLTLNGTSSTTLSALPTYLNLPAAASVAGGLFIVGGTEFTGVVLSTLLGVNPPGSAELTFSWDFGDGEQGIGESPAHVYAAPGTYLVTLTVSTPDGRSGSTTTTATVAVPPNSGPAAVPGGPYAGEEGMAIAFSGAGSTDPDNDVLSYAWDFGDGSTGTGDVPNHTYDDNGTYSVSLTVTDEHGVSSSPVSTTATIANVAPSITGLALSTDPVPVGTPVTLTGSFTDPSTLDTHEATVDWADGSGAAAAVVNQAGRTVSASRTFSAAGVYSVTLVVTDDDGGTDTQVATTYLVVYDPSAGFVTGGGWITSPVGAYPTSPTLTGKASFGFVSRYKKGATTPSGNTEFHFNAASFEFSSVSYQWLVVAGARAQFKGEGTINGAGNYGFILSAVDGQVSGGGGTDRFRIKIWDIATGSVIYDNQIGAADDAPASTVLGGGSIVIHP